MALAEAAGIGKSTAAKLLAARDAEGRATRNGSGNGRHLDRRGRV